MKEDLLKIINTYGVIPQLKYFQSEVFELNEAILYREHPNDITRPFKDMSARLNKTKAFDIEHITEEIVDNFVLLKQFQYYYEIPDEEIEEVMQFKINRQLERIEKGD